MIRCHFRKKESSSTENFDEFGPALLERLTSSLKAQDEEVVLRLPDDETFFDVSLYRTSIQESAQSAVQAIVGSSAPLWGQSICVADGDGWRLVWSPMAMNSQMQQTPGAFGKNGKRR